ncbi:MAG: hypothetical protein GXY76_12660 [Chloroflexi bacterium]|nr:hypothetical protein [Chloroflexota bacterium]
MNSRERVIAALSHREPDRTPVFEYVLLSPVADQLLGRPYAADPDGWDALAAEVGWEEAVRRNAVDRLELALRLGHDLIYLWAPPLPRGAPPLPRGAPPLPRGAPPPPPVADPVEALRRRNERAAAAPPPGDQEMLVYALLKAEMARRGADLPVLAPAYVHGVWTDVELMQTMLLAPDVAREHFQLATRRALALVDRYAALGLDLAGVGGDFAGTKLIISPQAYREFIVPEVRQVSRRAHAHGLYAINASDGDLWPVLDDFLYGCEVDGYLEIDMHAGMDLRRLKREHGARITFLGNLDCGITLSFGSEEEVRQHTLDCLEAGRGNGGHVLCASNAIAASVPLRNYLAVVNAYREWCGLSAYRL